MTQYLNMPYHLVKFIYQDQIDNIFMYFEKFNCSLISLLKMSLVKDITFIFPFFIQQKSMKFFLTKYFSFFKLYCFNEAYLRNNFR